MSQLNQMVELPQGVSPEVLAQLQAQFKGLSKSGIRLPTSTQHHEVVDLDQPILRAMFTD